MKRITAAATCIALLFSLGGCWDYRGLKELTVVAGIAIDISEHNPDNLLVTFEIVDTTSSSSEKSSTGKLIHTEGRTLFEAVYYAQQALKNELYFGSAEILIISQDYAKVQGVSTIFESVMRDFDARESILIIIARTEHAYDLIHTEEVGDQIISNNISQALSEGHPGINTTKAHSIAHGYDVLKDHATEMTHAAMNLEKTLDDTFILVTDGIAVFSDDKLVGFLDQDYMEPYLLTVEDVDNGLLVFHCDDPIFSEPSLISLSVLHKKSALHCEMRDGIPYMWIDITFDAHAVELSPNLAVLDKHSMEVITRACEEFLEQDLINMFELVQKEHGIEVFGFGDVMRDQDPELWREIEPDWNTLFQKAEFGASCTCTLRNSGQITKF